MKPDFSGWATKVGITCSDGRTIMPDAFKHQDGMQVPLVWQHDHNDPRKFLGHAVLHNRPEGVWVDAFFNDTERAQHALKLVQHDDIQHMSIWANKLGERAKKVMHGVIREVSLVMAGANPGAKIDPITIRHDDGEDDEMIEEGIITTDETLVHSYEGVKHMAEGDSKKDDTSDKDGASDKTVRDVIAGMTEEQQTVVHFLVNQAVEAGAAEDDDDTDTDKDSKKDDTAEHGDKEEKTVGSTSTHNVFDGSDVATEDRVYLSHDEMQGLLKDAQRIGSVQKAVEDYALAHDIDNIEVLFPDAKSVQDQPEMLSRRMEWVDRVIGGSRKSPFARIKTQSLDITDEEARAKGYIKGNVKTEEFVLAQKRTTDPTTVYKKQKLERDDMIDITDFDVVAWLKGEMRLLLEEEIARAALISDGRSNISDDKISEEHIRPIATDDGLFSIEINVNIADAGSSVQEIIDAVVMHRRYYKGTGSPTMFTTETLISQFLLMKDTVGRKIYKDLNELAAELRVKEIVAVEPMEEIDDLHAVIVNMGDYTFGANEGGKVAMFDDFDIDYNRYKYLIETRTCGALTKLKSAMVVRGVVGTDTLVTPLAPAFDGDDVVITDVTGVTYKDQDDNTLTNAGGPYTLSDEEMTITATADATYYFASSENTVWRYVNRP